MPGVAEPTVSKSEGKPSPWGEGVRVRTVEGCAESALPRTLPSVWDRPPVTEGTAYS